MEFRDYKPEELVGKKVLHTWGMPYSRSSEVRVIEKVSAKFFGISKLSKTNFSLEDGQERGDFRSSCRLITDEEVKNIEDKNKLKSDIQTRQAGLLRYHWTGIKITDDNLKKLNEIVKIIETLET